MKTAAPDPEFRIDDLETQGFVFVRGKALRAELDKLSRLQDWAEFVDSWNRLEPDLYLAQGARYRRRRHAVFHLRRGQSPELQPAQPHFQAPEYNPLYGGIMRWFEPLEPAVSAGASLRALLAVARAVFDRLSPKVEAWKVEVHQFRIETSSGLEGRPTPEGMHRDGVDHVLVALVRRCNIEQGTTEIESLAGEPLGSFTLSEPLDAAFVEDARVLHGVTPVRPLDPARGGFRDVVVVTFKQMADVAASPLPTASF